jgi:kynurenine--oxoglutarate transaminase/cysteine-S-conjugate beta-lyase/glutamine--phenylpyruvate transaminase
MCCYCVCALSTFQGHPRLVSALSKLYSQLLGHEINSQTEILVTAGAYEALFSTISGHTSPGDEVIIIEPFFDCYDPMVRAAGGIPRFIPLRLVSMLMSTPSA